MQLVGLSLLVGCIFVAIGIVCLQAARSVVETVHRYDEVCATGNTDRERDMYLTQLNGVGAPCTIALVASKRMQAPVLLYYGIDGFQQNHRRFVQSRSDSQTRGAAAPTTSYCPPQEYLNGNTSQLIRPCGLSAWSLFNDTFQVGQSSLSKYAELDGSKQVSIGGITVPVDESHLAWRQDQKLKYAAVPAEFFNTEPATRGGASIAGSLNADEHFIVWMRPATLPNFRKLWGRIAQDIPKGTELTITINNRYNSYRFGGQKHVILSTTGWIGGSSPFLGLAYVVVGGISLMLGLVMGLSQLLFRRKLGDLSRLSWTKPVASKPQRRGEEEMLDLAK